MTKQSISERALTAQRPPPSESTAITIGNMTVHAVKQAVVPTLRQAGDAPVLFTVLEAMRKGKPIRDSKTKAMMPAATLVRVRSLQNGRIYDYVVPAILKSTWCDEYDGGVYDDSIDDYALSPVGNSHHTYIGKSFLVQKGMKPDGKRYREIEAIEIDPAQIEIGPG